MLPNVKLHRLPNGMRVIVVRTPGRKRAYFELEIGSGHADEPLDKRQSAHLTEHLVARRWREALLADEPVHYVGSLYNATTGLHYTSYYTHCHPRHLRAVVSHLAAALDLTSVPELMFLEECARIVDEFLRRQITPRGTYDYRWSELYLGHDPRRAPHTPKESAASAGRLEIADVRAFQSSCYAANRAILTVVGDFQDREIVAFAAQAFAWPRRALAKRPPLVKPKTGRRVVHGRGGRARISFGWISEAVSYSEILELDCLFNRLNRFFEEGLEKDFHLYSSQAGYSWVDKFICVELQVNVKATDVAAVESRLRGEILRFLKQLDEKSWQHAIQALVVDCEMDTDNGQALAEGCSVRLDRWGKLITPADDIRLYRHLKLAAAKKLLERLTSTRPNILIVYDDAPAP